MEVAIRNEQAKQYITNKLDQVAQYEDDYFNDIQNISDLRAILQNLIFVGAKGFRGVVATALTGKYLNPSFDPLNNFYSCNPRSIFEQGIFYAFQNRIPCGKSDPLNVAKNTNVLDDEWANGKRPQSAAQAAVDYLRFLEGADVNQQDKIIDFFFFKLVEYGNSVSNVQIEIPEQSGMVNQVFAHNLLGFVLKYPESGTIPQLIVSKLMKKLYESSTIGVEGGEESVFGTNTTSKKPGDIWLEATNTPYNLFEITVKKVDYKRLDDCIDSLNAVGMLDKQVTFICRIPEDINTLEGIYAGALNYKGKYFNFLDLRCFIPSIVSLLSAEEIHMVTTEIQSFIQQVDRPLTTKNGWNEFFGS